MVSITRPLSVALATLFLAACTNSPQSVNANGTGTVRSCGAASLSNTIAPNGDTLQHLIGSVHEHSGFSDGEIGTTPADYFQAGRDLGLDFVMGSEHSDGLILPITFDEACLSERLFECLILPSTDNPGGSLTKWAYTQDLATNASTDNYTAVRGFEWTSDRFGHANIFFSQNQLDAKTTDGYLISMEGLWFWFGLDPSLGGGADGIMVFNHPGREDAIYSNIPDPAYTFNDFAYRADAAERVVGIEMFGKSSDAYDIENGAPTEGWYARALDNGWKLAPTGSEDEHGTRWAQPERAKTIILAKQNTTEDLKQAMLSRHFYAVAQHYNNIRLAFDADGYIMGSSYAAEAGKLVTLSGSVLQGFPEGGQLELVSNGGELLAQSSSNRISTEVAAEENERWYYLRLLNSDNLPVAYSAPIWIKAGNDAALCQ